MGKPYLKLSALIVVLLAVSSHVYESSALPVAEALLAEPESGPKPEADIIPGRIQNNPVLLVYDLLANLIASIPMVGVLLVEVLGLGRR